MVCRENKGRSFCIGLVKRMQRQGGGPAFHDAELQSSQHEYKHAFEGMTHAFAADPKKWKQTQIDVWTSLRAKIADSADFSEQDKYRQSEGRGGQPGLITRIDQELARLRTGKDEKGKPLKPEQRNSPEELMAIMRAGSALERTVPARENFLEMNARHRGIPMQQARTEWNQLMNRRGDFSNISLTDDYRDKLSAAGITAVDQANLGQSGRARDAMRIMEERRQDAVATLASRPTLRAGHTRARFLNPQSESAQLRCAACGQFGHEDPACPNGDLVSRKNTLDAVRAAHTNAIKARKHRALLDRSDAELQEEMDQAHPGQFTDVAAFRAMHQQNLDSFLGGKPERSDAELRAEEAQIAREQRALNKEFASRGGQRSWIQEIRYNPENGLLEVQPHDKVTSDGVAKKARPFIRRVSPETMQQVMDHPRGPGVAINEMGLIRNPGTTNYQFENADDAEAARTQKRCPSCGQWASLDAAHRCTIAGGPSEEYKLRNLAASAAYRDALLTADGDAPTTPSKAPSLRSTFPTESRPIAVRGPDGQPLHGQVVTAAPQALIDTVNHGDVAAPGVRASYPDAEVTGTFAVWEDIDAQRVMSPHPVAGSRGMRCTCSTYTESGKCPHITGTFNALRNKYGAVYARQAVPGGTSMASETAADAPLGTQRRVSYSQIQQMRATDNKAFNNIFTTRASTGGNLADPAAMPPRNNNGKPVDEPHRWDRNPNRTARTGTPIDLDDHKQVVYRMRKLLSGRPPRISFSVSPDRAGGITVNIPRKYRGTGQEAYYQGELRRLLGTDAVRGKQGFYIPPTPSARHNALDRAAGDPPRIRPSEWITSVDPERAAAARARRNEARGQNAGADDTLTGQRVSA